MKKSLFVLAVLGTLGGAASAQTSVNIYGIVDAGYVNESGGPAGVNNKITSGVQSGSRIGFRGNEDLGGGLSAKFLMEAGFNVDTGTSGQGGVLFGRQAYVGLGSNWGNVFLGRQYNPLHTALDQVDPFGTGLAGDIENIFPVTIRINNSIKYTTPEWIGFSADLLYGFGEVSGNNSANRTIGGSIGYANGPALVKAVYVRQEDPAGIDHSRSWMLGGKWDFGIAAAHAAYQSNTAPTTVANAATVDSRDWMVGVSAPIGSGKILASYIRADDRSFLNRDAKQWAIGYTYAVSKRTNFYTAYGRIINENGAAFTVGNATEAGTGDKAFNLGVRHLF